MEIIERFIDWVNPDWHESRVYGDGDDPDEIEDEEPEIDDVRGGQ